MKEVSASSTKMARYCTSSTCLMRGKREKENSYYNYLQFIVKVIIKERFEAAMVSNFPLLLLFERV